MKPPINLPGEPFRWATLAGLCFFECGAGARPRGAAAARMVGIPDGHPGPRIDRVYAPLDEKDLHCRLAAVPLNEAGILDFARGYGLLTVGAPEDLARAGRGGPVGERVWDWVATVVALRESVRLGAALARGEDDQALVEQLPAAEGGGFVYARPGDLLAYEDHLAKGARGGRERVGGRTRVEAAGELLARWLNRRLAHRRVFGAVGAARGAWSIGWRPATLAGALWVQLASVVARGGSYHRCLFCGSLFTVLRRGPGNHCFCSPRCRMAYCRRSDRIRDLARAGRQPGEIALEVGLEPGEVESVLAGEGPADNITG